MKTVALLASRCPNVIEYVQGVAQEIPHVQVEVCSVQTACQRANHPDVGMVLTHLGVDENGITRMLWSLAQEKRACPTVVLCDRAEEHQAAALLRAGAADYVSVPSELSRLQFLISVLTYRFRPSPEAATPDAAKEGDLFGKDEGLDHLTGQVRRVAPQETTVLLTGETGTGKTRLARLLHELSPRRGEPFLTVDCGSLAAGLIESELFGHAKGAFTGADRERAGKLSAAGNGTLFLDEVNSLPLPLQAKLLRAVDERVFEPVGSEKPRPVRARLVAATNVPLEQEVKAGRFRADLFYRLNVVGFQLPALRERRGRVVPLARTFLAEFAGRNGRDDLRGFSPAAERLLASYDWPGNIRELRNVVERAVALCPGTQVDWSDLPEQLRQHGTGEDWATKAGETSRAFPVNGLTGFAPSWAQVEEGAEIRRIQEALLKHGNKRSRAAEELGISRVGLYKKLLKYGLHKPGTRRNGEEEPVPEVGEEKTIVPDEPEMPNYTMFPTE
jgi:DNA-binding NtrC family response regulator